MRGSQGRQRKAEGGADATRRRNKALDLRLDERAITHVDAAVRREIQEGLPIEPLQDVHHLAELVNLSLDDVVACCADLQGRQDQGLVVARCAGQLDGFEFGIGDAGNLVEELDALVRGPLLRGLEGAGGGPVFQELVDLAQHLGSREHGEVVDVADDGRVEAGGFLQVAHGTGALHVGQGQGCCGQRHLIDEFPVEGVLCEIEVAGIAGREFAQGAGGAIGPRIGTGGTLNVATGQRDIGGGAGQADAGDAGVGEGLQFVRRTHAILVEVAPEADVGELGIEAAELAVVVAVEVGERGKAAGGLLSAAENSIDTEEFVAVVDGAVAVLVEGEEGVVALEPAGAGTDAVAVVVEEDLSVAVMPTVSRPSPSRSRAKGSIRWSKSF